MVAETKNVFLGMICLLIILSGFAALSWEVLWQIKSTLALGVSAWGTAITLIVTMGGMSLGAFLMGNALGKGLSMQALCLYGLLEIFIGLAGLWLNSAFSLLEKLDMWMYAQTPSSISLVYLFGIIVVCGIPTLCMGATLPVFGLISQKYNVSLAKLYGLNTFGAATGVMVVAFIVIPYVGVTHTIWIISFTNIAIGLSAGLLSLYRPLSILSTQTQTNQNVFEPMSWVKIFIVFVTGFATFTLEIAWFRSLLSIYPNTTDIFAIMLACTLIALSLAAKNIHRLKQKKKLLGTQLCIAGILILLWTILIEHVGMYITYYKKATAHLPVPNNLHTAEFVSNWLLNPHTFMINSTAIAFYIFNMALIFCWAYFIIVPPMRFLGVAFPWILDEQRSSSSIGKLYAINTLAAVMGSIGAAWFLLPTIGFAKTAWIAGIFILVAGISISPIKKRYIWGVLGIAALFIAIFFEMGTGKKHILGFFATDTEGHPAKVLDFFEGPEATVAAVEYNDGARALLINSTLAALESGRIYKPGAHYMAWMGHLPMLLHPDPKRALVICFGTGQTANAVRKENPIELDIVDINAHVFELGHYFRSNENVLGDPRVKAIVMDGRAYMRRTQTKYDVITLEPMPPGSAGVNALYSKEFYELARDRLEPNGVIAQWLPFHIVSPYYTASIAKTFIQVFPNAVLWLDPDSNTGILLGTKEDSSPLAIKWPGFARAPIMRDLSSDQVQKSVVMDSKTLRQYSQYGEVISDDNQLLAYGKVLYVTNMLNENFDLLHRINNKISLSPVGMFYP